MIRVLFFFFGVVFFTQLSALHVLQNTESQFANFEKPEVITVSTINGKPIIVNTDHFKFMVSGHFHGSSSSASGMPAASLMANLDTLNSLNLAFTICLGDLFLNVEKDYKNYEKYLFKKLNSPLFNAVGNHDIDNELYEKRYGKTYQYFDIGVNRFIILNTELNNGNIVGKQLDLLKEALQNNKRVKNIFIFMHRTLWADDYENLAELFPDNTKSATATNYQHEIYPLIIKASNNSKVFLFSGSIGGQAPASFLYHKLDNNITCIATAIRDLPRDAILVVSLNEADVDFNTISLNSTKVLPLQKYTVAWWKKNKVKKKPFNWRLVPLYIYQMVTHRYFWYGIGCVLIVVFSIYLIKKIRKKRGKKD